MAEITEPRKKSGKRSTRVDLTPMEDLGFLLITFFIFTTALTRPTGMKFYLPKPALEQDKMHVPESGVLTILLGGNDQIYSYEGADPGNITLAGKNEIRSLILDKKQRTKPEKFVIVIKPGKESNFLALVKIMDEMTINSVKHYAMVDMEPVEYNIIRNIKP